MNDSDKNREDDIFQSGEKPDLELLTKLYSDSKNGLSAEYSYYTRMQEVRYCRWPGQNLIDGKKHKDKDGRVFPWEGASDLRTFAVDDIINSLAASAMCSLYRARISAIPRTTADCTRAGQIAQFTDWYFKSAIPQARREVSLWLQWGLTQGKSVMGVFWERTEGFGKISVNAPSAAAASAAISEYILDENSPEPSAEAISDAKQNWDLDSNEETKKFLMSLKLAGSADVRVKKIIADRVKLKALRPGIDFFCPNNIENMESAPCVFLRERLTVSDFRARAVSNQWPSKFVESAVKTCSNTNDESGLSYASNSLSTARDYSSTSAESISSRLIEICTAYYKSHDKNGAMSLRYCVFCPSVPDSFAEAGEYDIAPSRFPFVVYAREHVERELLDSRGIAEIAEGWQREIKTQKDARIDKTSLDINPPKLYRAGRKPTDYRPGAWIPVSGSEFKIMENALQQGDSKGAFEIETQVSAEMAAYFGVQKDNAQNPEIAVKKQAFIDGFLAACGKMLEQIYFLYRQFGPNRTIFAPVDEPEGTLVEFNNIADSGDFEFSLSFDARDENLELFLKKFDVAQKFIAAFDKTGSVNTSRLLKRLLGMLFPDEIKTLVSSEEDSFRRETLETQNDLAAIYSAQPVNAPEHCNAQLRLQIVSQYVQTPSVSARLATDKDFATALQNYAKQLQFQIQQSQNAVIGRIGSAPAEGMPSEMEVPA